VWPHTSLPAHCVALPSPAHQTTRSLTYEIHYELPHLRICADMRGPVDDWARWSDDVERPQGVPVSDAVVNRPVVRFGLAAIAILAIATLWNRIACRVLSCCP